MKKRPLVTVFPLLLIAKTVYSDDNQYLGVTLSNNHETIDIETIQGRSINTELSVKSAGVFYSYTSKNGLIISANAWNEGASKSLRSGVELEKEASGYGFAVALPVSDFELEFNYGQSQPELIAIFASENYVRHEHEVKDYGFRTSYFWFTGSWAIVPSLQLGYQESAFREVSQERAPPITTDIEESGTFWSASTNVNYFFAVNDKLSISPFFHVSWSDFFNGEGSTNNSAHGRRVSRNREANSEFISEASGAVSLGVNLNYSHYSLEISADEAINQEDIDTRFNVSIGVAW